jgi:phenylpropionate dioxygenase-like ring-hydroxylating dioxygenase large terminal subunit
VAVGQSSSEQQWLREEMVALTKRLIAHVENGTTDHANDVFREPVANYTDQVKWERERERLFRKSPLLLGLSGDLPEPGSYRALTICDVPVLLIRGEDRVARAFVNVCRHRGAPIIDDERGKQRRYTCVYHAWTYDTAGCLVGLPSADAFDGIERSEHGLRRLPLEERHGMLWGVLTPGGDLDVAGWLGEDLDREFAGFDFASCEWFVSYSIDAANWKLAMDTYFEAYHFASLHRNTINLITYNDVIAFDAFQQHQRNGFPRRNVLELRAVPQTDWEPLNHMSSIYKVFPNNAVTVAPEAVLVSQVLPGPTVDTSITIQSTYSRSPIDSAERRAELDKRARFIRDVILEEDYFLNHKIGAGLRSGANEHLTFGRNEPGLHHFHRMVEEVAHR